MPVFHRIVMDVIEVAAEVVTVTDGVFPEASLPIIRPSFKSARAGQRCCHRLVGKVVLREGSFDD